MRAKFYTGSPVTVSGGAAVITARLSAVRQILKIIATAGAKRRAPIII